MHVCYVDVSGELGALPVSAASNDRPVVGMFGLFADVARLEALTNDFLILKRRSISTNGLAVKGAFGATLKNLQYRYQDPVGGRQTVVSPVIRVT